MVLQPRQILPFIGALALLIGLSSGAFAQSSTWKKAQRLYKEYEDYNGAIELFKKDLAKKSNVESTMGVGNCYRMLGDYTNAVEWYNKALDFSTYDLTVHLYLAEILMQGDRFEEAKTHLREYKKSPYASPIAVQRFLATCDSGIIWTARAFPGVLRSEDDLNTPSNDWGVSRYGSSFAFCSNRDSISINSPYEEDNYKLQRVLKADFDGNEWKNISAFERPINGANFNAGPIVFFKDGKNFIEARSSGNPDVPRMTIKTLNNTGLYYPADDGTIVSFYYNNVVQYSVDGPCLSADEQTLYFSSNMPGGYGGFDLYYSIRNADGTWGDAQNLGASVNTSGDEVYPSLGADGTLYFASSGLAGMGGLDIFSVKMQGNSVAGNPVNMGYPMNSGADDFSALQLSRDKFLFASTRKGGKGGSDIYSFAFDRTKPRPNYTLPVEPAVTTVAEAEIAQPAVEEEMEAKVTPVVEEQPAQAEPAQIEPTPQPEEKVVEAEPEKVAVEKTPEVTPEPEPKPTPEPEPVKVEPAVAVTPVVPPVAETTPADEFNIRIEAIDRNKKPLNNTTIKLTDNTSGKSTQLSTDANGAVVVNIVLGMPYTLTASKNGYNAASIKFSIPNADKKVVARLTLESLLLNRDVRLTGLYYDNKRWNLKEGGEKELDKLVKLLNENSRLQIEIKSYSSDNGRQELDLELAQKRARNVLNYLAFKGIEENRIYASGFAMKGSSDEGTSHRTMYRLFREGDREVNAAEVKRKAAADQRAKQQAARLQQQKKATEARKQQQAAAAKKRATATAAARQRQLQLQAQRQQQQRQALQRRQAAAAAKAKQAQQPKPQAKQVAPPQPFESFEIKTID